MTHKLLQTRQIEDEKASNPFGGVRTEEQENFAIERAFNMTVTPRQGPCGGRHSSLDGSCNDENSRGAVLDAYSRIGTGFKTDKKVDVALLNKI